MNDHFFMVDNHIFDYGLKSRDIAVYCASCRHRNKETGVAFPSRKTIAKECGIGKADTVDKALGKLCKMGLIKKQYQYMQSGGYASNIYTISEIGDMVTHAEGYKQDSFNKDDYYQGGKV